eukprot:scaffold5771_cov171-Amphora_coffeaeformis.AAC.4
MSHHQHINNSKLHPIYTALDHQQYNRAIKLCLQQPADNLYVQALLAHAYVKTDQRAKALDLLCGVLLTHAPQSSQVDYFVELRLAHQYAQTGIAQQSSSPQPVAAAATETPRKGGGGGGGKKGKKKPTASSPTKGAATAATPTTTTTDADWDWIDVLDKEPLLPAETFAVIPTWPVPPELADPGLLSTLSITLQLLRLNLTSYQLSHWWATTLTSSPTVMLTPADILSHLKDTFLEGITVWMAPQYQKLPVQTTVLPQLQVLALQMARLETPVEQAKATLWAAQTALWQCASTNGVQVEASKLALLPRLAENLAAKPVGFPVGDDHDTSRLTAEGFLLLLQALQVQNKWQEYLDAVNAKLEANDEGKPVMGLSPAMLLDYKSKALAQLGQSEEARAVAAQSLREQNPDQWDMWTRHLDCDETDAYQATTTLAQELTLDTSKEGAVRHYPRRGPPLAVLEALRRRIVKTEDTIAKGALFQELLVQIQSYGDAFGSRTACTFADLTACLDCIHEHGDSKIATTLMPWLYNMRLRPSAEVSSKRHAELRAFIFALQTTLKLLHYFPELQKDWLPDWKELVRAWIEFQIFEDAFKAAQTEEDRKNAQKESRPADEVILLAVQLLLHENSTSHGLILSATLLEKAIEQSPYNAYLKLLAIFVYAELNAVSRSWDLFKELFIKHVQFESSSYLILPLLRAGGMYKQVIQVCQDIIRLQRTALRDANDFTAKALDNGTLSKADEFVTFQRDRINKSLTSLEAKGLIMDCAPMFKKDERQADIGAMHGIVGGDDDMERVQNMISEAHNPQGSFSLLHVKGNVADILPGLSENRDLDALAYQVFRFESFPTSEQIVCDCIRRSHHHNLLLRAALCIDAAKGPKKGKVIKPSEELAKRCKSLVARVKEAEAFAESELKSPTGYGMVLLSMAKLCRAIAVLSGGFVTSEPSPQDSVSFREDQTAVLLQQAVEKLKSSHEHLNLSFSVSTSGVAIPDLIIPMLALLRMCAKVNELYGWTKKRRTIRKCAGCLYDFMGALSDLIEDMEKSVQSVELDHANFALPDELKEGIASDIVTDDDVGETVFLVHGAQGQTKMRLERIISSVRSELATFDTEE